MSTVYEYENYNLPQLKDRECPMSKWLTIRESKKRDVVTNSFIFYENFNSIYHDQFCKRETKGVNNIEEQQKT